MPGWIKLRPTRRPSAERFFEVHLGGFPEVTRYVVGVVQFAQAQHPSFHAAQLRCGTADHAGHFGCVSRHSNSRPKLLCKRIVGPGRLALAFVEAVLVR